MSGLLGGGGAWLRRKLIDPEYPLTAVEVRPRALGVARLLREGGRLRLAAAASLELSPGTLALSMTQPNVVDGPAFQKALATVLERAGALKEGAVGLVLPDPVARIALLAPSEVGSRRDARDMARFRLRKALPFDVRDARIGVLLPRGIPGGQALVGAIYGPVLRGYEEALAALGLETGLVEVTGLALTAAVGPEGEAGDRLLVNWDEGYLSLLLTRNGWPILHRTLGGESASAPESVAREVANTVLYYRERLGGAGLTGAWVRSAILAPEAAVSLLADPLGLSPRLLDPWPLLGAGEGGAAAQAVAGAAACALRRAA